MTKQVTTATAKRTRTAVKTAAKTAEPTVFYQLAEGARPTHGARMYAHTHAVLSFLGLLDGKSAMRKAAEALLGRSAIHYHTDNKNLAVSSNVVKLTARGLQNFKARADTGKVDLDMAGAFLAAISKGKSSVAYSIPKEHLCAVHGVSLH